MGLVMAQQMKTEMEPQCETEHSYDVAEESEAWEMPVHDDKDEDKDDEMEAQPEEDHSDESESASESPVATNSVAKYGKFIILLWRVLSFPAMLASLCSPGLWGLSTTEEEAVEIASGFNLDVECCTGQATGFTAMCMEASACLPCESLISDAVSRESIGNSSNFTFGMESKESVGNSSSFTLGVETCIGQVKGVMWTSLEDFARKACKLVAGLSCDSELHGNQMWQNVSQDKAISMNPELPKITLSHNISQQMQEETAKPSLQQWCPPSLQQWCPVWPGVGVSGALVAISVKLMVF